MEETLEPPFYVVLMKTSDHIALLADGDGAISAKQHSHEWINEFEDNYNRNHYRSYEGSMSACINFIMMQPSVVRVSGIDDIKERLVDEKTARVCSFNSVAGGFSGIISDKDRESLEKIWSSGSQPRLISG